MNIDSASRSGTPRASSMLLFLAAALLPVTAAAQSPDQQIQNALEQAEEMGIPTALLQSKIDEGRAKGVPVERIAAAVQQRLDGLSQAQDALEGLPDVSTGDLDVSADALQSGVSEAVLAELAESAPADRRAAAIATLGYLVDANIAPQQALARVQEAMARGPQALQNLPAQAVGPGAAGPAGPPDGVPAGGPPGDVGPPDGVPAPGDGPGAGPSGGAGPGGDAGPGSGGRPGSGGGPGDPPGPGAPGF